MASWVVATWEHLLNRQTRLKRLTSRKLHTCKRTVIKPKVHSDPNILLEPMTQQGYK